MNNINLYAKEDGLFFMYVGQLKLLFNYICLFFYYFHHFL